MGSLSEGFGTSTLRSFTTEGRARRKRQGNLCRLTIASPEPGRMIVSFKGFIGGMSEDMPRGELMLTIKWGPDRSTFLESRRIYVLLRDDTEIGRIEVCAPGRHAIQGHVTVQGSEFQCRIHLGAEPRPRIDRWVMYTGETELHAARCEGIRTFQVDEVPGLGLLRLRPEGLLSGAEFVIDRMPDERRIGDVRYPECQDPSQTARTPIPARDDAGPPRDA